MDKRVEEAREKAKRGRARAYQTHVFDGCDDHCNMEATQWDVAHHRAHCGEDIETVLERLVVECTRDAGGD